MLAELFQKAVSEDGTLAYADRQTLLRAVSLDTSGKWKLNSLAYEEEPRVGPGVTLAAAEDRPEQYDEGRPVFQFSPGEGWSLWPKGKRVSPAGEEEVHSVAPAVEVATASALMLVQDVLIFNPHGSWNSRPLLQGHPLRKRWAMTEWRVDYWQRPVITWPTPIWSTFWEYDLFLGHWNATLAEYSSRTANNDAERRLDYLVFTWMDAATAVLLGEEPIGTRRQGSSLVCHGVNSWNASATSLDHRGKATRAKINAMDGYSMWVSCCSRRLLAYPGGVPRSSCFRNHSGVTGKRERGR